MQRKRSAMKTAKRIAANLLIFNATYAMRELKEKWRGNRGFQFAILGANNAKL